MLLMVSLVPACGGQATLPPVPDSAMVSPTLTSTPVTPLLPPTTGSVFVLPTVTSTSTPLVIPTFTPVPTLSGEAGVNPGSLIVDELAFLSWQGEDAWLYTVAVDGSGLTRVSEAVYQWDQPQWSPDGSALAFRIDEAEDISSLYMIRESDPAPVRVTTGLDVSSYAWSPESDRIAFSAVVEGEEDIYLLSLDTLAPVNVTSSQGIVEYEPVWSPTGTQIAFQSASGASSHLVCLGECGYRIYVMDVDSLVGNRQIWVNPDNLYEGVECDPTWSLDGRYLALIQGCEIVGNWIPCLFDSQDGSISQLATDWHFKVWKVDWISEDELSLFYPHEQADRVTYKDRFYAINRSGKNMHPLFPGANLDVAAGSWTSNHRLYAWHDKTSHEIFIGDMTTNQSVSMGIQGCDPEWSPSGDWLAFTTECLEEAQESDVWVVRRDGSGLLNLTETVPGDSSNVAWRP
mgnify:CR=1 FL=1